MATIKEIALRAKVSMATVSRVLNKDDKIVVSDTVRNEIFTIAHELGYVPPKQRRIPLENGITIGVADWHIIRKDRTNLKLSDFSNMAKRFCKTPVNFVQLYFNEQINVDGVIALGKFSKQEVDFLKQQSSFVLFVDSNQVGYQYDRIIIDHSVGIIDMIDYFINVKNYSSIGYIGGIFKGENIIIGKTRTHSFKQLLKNVDKYNPKYFIEGNMTSESGYKLFNKLYEQGNLPNALLIGNDEIAEGVLEAINEKNISNNIEIVIYKDIETLLSLNKNISSIQVYTDFMWKYAIKMLLQRIGGKRLEVLTLTFPSKFVRY